MWSVTEICKGTTELYPNTNLVALIREKCGEFVTQKRVEQSKVRQIEQEPDYDEIEKSKKDWNALRDKLAREKSIDPEAKKREGKV